MFILWWLSAAIHLRMISDLTNLLSNIPILWVLLEYLLTLYLYI